MEKNYTYRGALEASERIGWRIEDIIGGEKRLDFSSRSCRRRSRR
jgi:hypothetical protein